jgi:WD40 repeat protein
VSAVAVGALSDGTPVIVSGGEESDDEDDDDVTVRVWRLADGTPAKKSLHPYADWVTAVAVGALPDGTSVIVSGGEDGTVQVWRLADGTPLAPPLGLPERVSSVVVRGDAIVVAAGARVAVHKPTLLRPTR